MYLLSIASVTIYHKSSSLKQHKFIGSVSVGQRLRGSTGSSAQGLLGADIEVWAGLFSLLELLEKDQLPSFFLLLTHSVLCTVRTQIPYGISQGLVLASWGCLHFSSCFLRGPSSSRVRCLWPFFVPHLSDSWTLLSPFPSVIPAPGTSYCFLNTDASCFHTC